MNKTLERIKQLDAQIALMEKFMVQGEYKAAGITLDITIGPAADGDTSGVVLELVNDLDDLMMLIHRSLVASRKEYLVWARQDYAELKAFLSPEPQE